MTGVQTCALPISGFDRLIDVNDLAIFANVDRPSLGIAVGRINEAVRLSNLATGIAQQREVELQFVGKLLVQLLFIATGAKISDFKLLQGGAAVTQRLAFRRSATGLCFGIPSDHHRLLPDKIGELVHLAVTALQLKGRRGIADLWFGSLRTHWHAS